MADLDDRSVLTLTLQVDDERSGRAFVQAKAFFSRSVQDVTLAVREAFLMNFEDEDDLERLALIEAALSREVEIPVELYPTESAPARWEAFFRLRVEPNSPPESISACMLFPMMVVQERLERAPHWFTESSVLQVVQDAGSDIEVAAALQLWVARLWPNLGRPNFHVERWPNIKTHRSVSKLPVAAALGAPHDIPNRKLDAPHLGQPLLAPDFLQAADALERAG